MPRKRRSLSSILVPSFLHLSSPVSSPTAANIPVSSPREDAFDTSDKSTDPSAWYSPPPSSSIDHTLSIPIPTSPSAASSLSSASSSAYTPPSDLLDDDPFADLSRKDATIPVVFNLPTVTLQTSSGNEHSSANKHKRGPTRGRTISEIAIPPAGLTGTTATPAGTTNPMVAANANGTATTSTSSLGRPPPPRSPLSPPSESAEQPSSADGHSSAVRARKRASSTGLHGHSHSISASPRQHSTSTASTAATSPSTGLLHVPVRPAHTKPAFQSRPSLPSLRTLAQMNIVAPPKVRRGKPGAGLPAEPWAPTPVRLPTWPPPHESYAVQEDEEEVMMVASHVPSLEPPQPLQEGQAPYLSSSLSVATPVAPVLGSNDGLSTIMATVPIPTPTTTAYHNTFPHSSSETWQVGPSILELSEPISDEDDDNDDEGADDDEIKYPGLLDALDTDDDHSVTSRRHHHHHQTDDEEDFGMPYSPSSNTFSRAKSDAVFSWKVDELVSMSPTRRIVEMDHSATTVALESPSGARQSGSTSESCWRSTCSSVSSSSSSVSAGPSTTRSTSVGSSVGYLGEEECSPETSGAVEEYDVDETEEQNYDASDDHDGEGHASDREFYAHHSDYSSSYCSYSSSSSEHDSRSSSPLMLPSSIPVRQSALLAVRQADVSGSGGAAGNSISKSALFEPGTSANTIRAAVSPIYWASHRASMVYVGHDADERGIVEAPSKGVQAGEHDVQHHDQDAMSSSQQAEMYASQTPEPALELPQPCSSVPTSASSTPPVPDNEPLAPDNLTEKLQDVQATRKTSLKFEHRPPVPTHRSSSPISARSLSSNMSTTPSLATRWLRHVRSFHKPVQPLPPSTLVPAPAASSAVLPRASGVVPPVPPLPAGVSASSTRNNSRAPSPTRMKTAQLTQQQRVFIGDMQRFSVVELSSTSTAADLLSLLDSQGALDGWRGSGGWMVYEVALDFGMERPVRSFELLSDVTDAWNKEKMVNTFIVKLSPLASVLSRVNIPSVSPTHAGWVRYESKRGKWCKRWLQLRDHNLYLSKRENGKDEECICSVANFDAYYTTRPHRSPKPFVFAAKTTESISALDKIANFLHIFSCNEKEGEVWMEKILLARSCYQYQEANIIGGSAPSEALPAPVVATEDISPSLMS